MSGRFGKKPILNLAMLLLFVSFALALANPIARRFGPRKPRFCYSQGILSQDDYAKLGQRPGWTAVPIVMSDGVALKGLVRRPAQSGKPWAIFYPGNDFTQLAKGQEFLENVRSDRDWGLAVTAYRGYDSNGGTLTASALASDALQIYYSLLTRERIAPAQVNLVAFSLGGYAATYVYSQTARTSRCPATLSLLASVRDVGMFHASWLSKFTSGDSYNTKNFLDLIARPVLVLNGGNDTALGVEHGRAIAAQLGEKANYVELPGVTHESFLGDQRAFAAVRHWIESSTH